MIWIGLVFLLVGIIINFIATMMDDGLSGVYVGTVLACAGAAIMVSARYEAHPTALDVYRGKTTLEITYKDGIAVDTVVVFKNKEK